jgi:hypothetical protein
VTGSRSATIGSTWPAPRHAVQEVLTSLVRLVGLVAVGVISAHSTASAATFTYDAPPIARDVVRGSPAADASLGVVSDVQEGSDLRSVEARGTSTAPLALRNATNTARGGVGPLRHGQAGVDAVAADIEAAGSRVVGREITVEARGVPVGANAAAAGLTQGVPIGPTPVWVVHLS